MKDEVKIYGKLDEKIIKKFTISTISTKTYYFKDRATILHYFILPTTEKIYYFLLFIYVPTFYTKT